MTEAHLMCPRDGVRIFLLTVVRGFEGGVLPCFELHVLVVVVVLEVGVTLLGLEFGIALSVFVDSVRTGLATTDEVRHGVEVGRFFSLKRGESPILGWGGAHGRHASLPP